MKPSVGIWGDSLLQGVVLDEIQGRYSVLKNNCAAAIASKLGIKIANNSRFGCTAPKGQRFLVKALEAPSDISLAVLEYGGNDCDFNWEEVAKDPDAAHLPKTPLDQFKACYAEMILAVKAKGIEPVLMSLPPLDAERYFDWITRNGNSKENILKWLGDVQHIYRWQERYSMAVASLARQYNCRMVDVREAFLSQWDYRKFLCADGIHPNEAGHDLMKQAFEEYTLDLALA